MIIIDAYSGVCWRMLAQNNATEEERHANPVVWMGWKGFKPKNINRRSGSEAFGPTWSLDDAAGMLGYEQIH